ncbi:MAG: dihydroorotate dehydrogenase electron transfer subunit [Thaumarchaeota archaeon]|nr:dihydroorotate dehydrogenase electron transfer subunit [Nitrososphaerota archaeon]
MALPTIDIIRTTNISRVVQESVNIRTFVFEDALSCSAGPGQFVMVWLPGVGEFPMSVSLSYGRNQSSIVVKPMGEGSKALYESKSGDRIGVRGPYGVPFSLPKSSKRVLMVGGGTGMAPMISLAYLLSKTKTRVSMVIAAKSKQELPFVGKARRLLGKENVYPATDDGSFGFKGLAHEKALEIIERKKPDQIFACGPELMMRALYLIAKERQIRVQFSLERIMKCGIGICGSCSIGDIVLCKDGPVLDNEKLEKISSEFGLKFRDKAGRLVLRYPRTTRLKGNGVGVIQ